MLGYDRVSSEQLIKSVDNFDLRDHPKPDPQLNVFQHAWDLQLTPPVNLLSPIERTRLYELEDLIFRSKEPPINGELDRLRQLLAWEDRLQRMHAHPLPSADNSSEKELLPLDISSIRGVRLPVDHVKEDRGGALYEYYPISDHIVAAPRVCGGRATFKYTRIDVRHVLPQLTAGTPFEQINLQFGGSLSPEALTEARLLASQNGPDVFQRPLVPMNAPCDHS